MLPLEITLNRLPVLQPDPAGQIERHIDQYLELIYRQSQFNYSKTLRRIDDDCCTPRRDIVEGSVPSEPRLKLNQLFIPAGMRRWSRVFLLVDLDGMNKIRENETNQQPSIFEFNLGRFYSFKLWCIGSCRIGDDDDEAWIVEMVDSRYWAQFVAMTKMPIYNTWESLLLEIQSVFRNNPRTADIATDYDANFKTWGNPGIGEPDRRYFNRPGESAALLFDQARFSFDLSFFKAVWRVGIFNNRIAGSRLPDFKMRLRRSLYFTRKVAGKLKCENDPWIVDNYPNDPSFSIPIHVSETADFDAPGSPTPSNQVWLQQLAEYYGKPFEFGGRTTTARMVTGPDIYEEDLPFDAVFDFSPFAPAAWKIQSPTLNEIGLGQIFVVQSQPAAKQCPDDEDDGDSNLREMYRFELLEELPIGNSALAKILDCSCTQGITITLFDIDLKSSLRRGTNHTHYSPAGATGTVRRCLNSDGTTNSWHVVSIGMGICEESCHEYENGQAYACTMVVQEYLSDYDEGTCDRKCEFRYNVYNSDGHQVMSDVDLNDDEFSDWRRLDKTKYLPATRGLFYYVCGAYSPNGWSPRLSWCNEVPEIGSCADQNAGVMRACEEECHPECCTSGCPTGCSSESPSTSGGTSASTSGGTSGSTSGGTSGSSNGSSGGTSGLTSGSLTPPPTSVA